ncbi:hypothetical protein YN1_8530 [Nanoarchaeota archaeon]
MNKEGLLELRIGSLIYTFGTIFIYLGIFFGIFKGLLIIIGTLINIFGTIHTWNGFDKIMNEFKDYDIGKIGSVLTLILVGFIILGIVYYSLGKKLNNDNIKIGGILTIFFPFIGQLIIHLELNSILNKLIN